MGANNTALYQPGDTLDYLVEEYKIALTVCQICLCVLGSSGNILTILAVILAKHLHRTHNIYIAHLACVDLLINAFLIPTNIYGFQYGIPSNCPVIGAISIICLVVSILSLLMVALNRYILICKDASTYARFYNRKTVSVSIVVMWLYACALIIPMQSFHALGWSVKTWYCFFVNYDFSTYIYVSVCMSQLGVVAPAGGTALCYVLIMRKMRASAKKLAPKLPTGNNTVTVSTLHTGINSYSGKK